MTKNPQGPAVIRIRPVSDEERRTWPKDVIVSLERPFVDERGRIMPLVDLPMESCVLIESKKGSVRANHYHRSDWHFCYVLSGSILYLHRPHGSEVEPEKVMIGQGQLFFTPPMVDHAMVFPEDTTFLVLGRNSRTQEVYEADVVRIAPMHDHEHEHLHQLAPEPDSRRRSTCRLCSSGGLSKVLSLAPTPLANAFVTAEERDAEQRRYPIELGMCRECGHVQLLDVVDPRKLYEHYVYVSGTSPVFVRHFESYARYVCERFAPTPGGLVVDIGSNDGTLLRFFQKAGSRVIGIDPAKEIGEASRRSGIPVITGFFTPELGARIAAEHGHADVITANNVIAHIDDLNAVVQGIGHLLSPGGVFVFEVSYLVDVLDKTLFDTIYHEHLDYHTVEPLVPFFARHGLELIEAIRVDTHGGSLRGVVQRAGGRHPVGASVGEAIANETRMQMREEGTFRAFDDHIREIGEQLVRLLRELKSQGKSIAGFGAPAKATTLLYQLGIEPDMIDFIVDDSPLKQGRFSPGMHIPVVPAQELYDRRPDYVVVLAWNFAQPIVAKHAAYREGGGRFIVPLPEIEIH